MEPVNNIIYQEPLTAIELDSLQKMYRSETKKMWYMYRKISLVLIAVAMGIMIFVSIGFVVDPPDPPEFPDQEPLTLSAILSTIGIAILVICSGLGLAFLAAFWYNVRPFKRDIVAGYKLVETTNILHKQYMPHNDTYYFTIRSSIGLSLEIDQAAYQFYEIGDEINIEYTRYARYRLGFH